MQSDIATSSDPGKVLAKATSRASELLGLSGAGLARVLGLSEATVSRIVKGEKSIKPESKAGELALLLVQVCRSVDALVGKDEQKRKEWMASYSKALNGQPLKLVQRVEGLVATANYLDAMRNS